MRIFSDSNETLIELFDISQEDVMNLITNDKLREQAPTCNFLGHTKDHGSTVSLEALNSLFQKINILTGQSVVTLTVYIYNRSSTALFKLLAVTAQIDRVVTAR